MIVDELIEDGIPRPDGPADVAQFDETRVAVTFQDRLAALRRGTV